MLFNRPRALEYMRRHGVDALVATSPLNITYFTDYYLWTDPQMKGFMMSPGASSNLAQAYAVFPLDGEPALVVGPLMAVNAADLWVNDLYLFGDAGLDHSLPPRDMPVHLRRLYDLLLAPQRDATPTDALVSILGDRGLAGARIGLEMDGLPPETKDAIERELPGAAIKDCSNLIRLLRMVKSADELIRLTRSVEINERIAMESLALARPGMAFSELIQHYRARAAELGADFDHFAFGVRGMGIATEPDYVLTDDDVLYTDFGCIYQYYFSDAGATLAMPQAPLVLLERYAATQACIEVAVETARPGVKASQVRAAMWETLNRDGSIVSFPHGHGLGLELRGYPIIVPDNGLRIRDDCVDVASDLLLEADMVFSLEVGVFMPGVGSLQNEQTFIVTSDGCQQLVPQDRKRPVQPVE